VQALTPTVFPCYAPADRAMAAAIAALVEGVGDARVFLEEGALGAGDDLAAKAREARVADVVLVLFSRESLPPRWGRAQWEDALVKEPAAEGVRIGFVICDDCIPPRVLAPRFDGRTVEGRRELKRWIRNREYVPRASTASTDQRGDLGILGIALADRPGVETVAEASLAFEFADAFRDDFDEVLRLECGERTRTALAGELATRLELRLEGDAEDVLQRLREFCAIRRYLLLLDGARTPAARELAMSGRCSTLYCLETGPAEDHRAGFPARGAGRLGREQRRVDGAVPACPCGPARGARAGPHRRTARADGAVEKRSRAARGPPRPGRSHQGDCVDSRKLGPLRGSPPPGVSARHGVRRTTALTARRLLRGARPVYSLSIDSRWVVFPWI
jgi:hypothetical protein